jgi:alpha-tubulin suppressor-like RCC1 family protein
MVASRVTASVVIAVAWLGLANDASAQARTLSLGQSHACEVTPAGGVQCWGTNFSAQLGDGTKVFRPQPAPVSGLSSGVIAVAQGFNHGCALTGAGAVKCWGFNGTGQLGSGNFNESLVPADVVGLGGPATQITVGDFFSCALLQGGSVQCWGRGSSGALGNNATANSNTPVQVQGLTSGVLQIDAGGSHACAVLSAGTLQCWGEGSGGQLGDNTATDRLTPVNVPIAGNVTAVSAGTNHTCARIESGEVQCWGLNVSGELGDGTLAGRNAPVATGFGPNAVQVSTGSNFTCARRSNGSIVCAGANGVGLLGNNSNVTTATPVPVSGINDAVELDSALSGFFSCVRRGNGQTVCWGENVFGQIGIGSIDLFPTPGALAFAGGFTRLALNDDHQCGIAAVGGAVHCWGGNRSGQLGNGTVARLLSVPASPVATVGAGALDVAAGIAHSCALSSTGAAFCWGQNAFGQLGNNSTVDEVLPTAVIGIGSGATQIVAGDVHTCALINGGVRCFGQGAAGQLGTGTNGLTTTPVPVVGLGAGAGVTQITAGGSHVCALVGGAVSCWGSDANGQLGNDAVAANSNLPVPVQGLGSGVAQIAAGRFHTCARLSSGELRCWGANPDGRLGDGSNSQRLTPVTVAGFASGAIDVSAGFNHTCAVTSTGAARCWGEGNLGQRGDGINVAVTSSASPTTRNTPADVLNIGGATRVFAGGQFACALSGTAAQCWGHNRNGALGNGRSSSYLVPVPIVTVVGNTATTEAPLPPPPTAAPGDLAGSAVAASDTLIVVGAPNAGAQQRGAVYVYERDTSGPVAPVNDKAGLLRETKGLGAPVVLNWSGGGVGDKFGSAVAVMPDDTRIAVGVPTADAGAGTVVIFTEPVGGWSGSVATPQELDPANGGGVTVQGFGTAVDFAADATLAVGAPLSDSADKFNAGAVIAARGSAGGYTQLGAPLLAGTPQDGAAMGTSVSIEGGVFVAGAPLEDVSGRADQGAIHVFPDTGAAFGAPSTTTASTGDVGDKFGSAVAVNTRGIVAVGAPDAATPLGADTGAVYVLLPQSAGGYVEGAVLLPSAGGDQNLGTAVAINDNSIVAGAPNASVGGAENAGQVLVYNEPANGWSGARAPDAVLAGISSTAGDSYGSAVAASPRAIVVGVPLEDPAASGGGSAADQGSAESFVFDRVLRADFE